MELPQVFEKLGIALGLGLLVGMQRERISNTPAGIRTFALATVLGTVCTLLADDAGPWMPVAGFLALAALLVAAHVVQREEDDHPGLTTEVAALLMFGVGAYLVKGHAEAALAVGGGVAVLLHWKTAMHELISRIGEDDLKSIFQLVLLALVILPVLPNRTYGPYDVLNPHKIWLMVVLIVGIGLAGYLVIKVVGPREGALLHGAAGGLVSSTATTVSAARQGLDNPQTAPLAAFAVQLASTVAMMRVLVEVAAAAPGSAASIVPPLLAVLGWMVVVSAAAWFLRSPEKLEQTEYRNPARLLVALLFGATYALVLLAVAAAKEHVGTAGLYAVAAVSGLVDIDAITLSSASLAETGQLDVSDCRRLILIGFLSNLVFKAGIVAVVAGGEMFRRVLVLFGASAAGLLLILLLWA